MDISVVEIGSRKYTYSRVKPKVDPTQIALSAEKMVGDENCDKTGKEMTHSGEHNILHCSYHWQRSPNVAIVSFPTFLEVAGL